MRIDHFIFEGDRHKGDYVMTIRSLAGAGMVALASAFVCGWTASPAMAKGAPPASSTQSNASTTNLSYPLSLRGNATDLFYDSGANCNFCSPDNYGSCECVFFSSGSQTFWQWNTNPYTVIGYQIEVDYYLDTGIDNGTEGFCSPATGGISVDGTFSPNGVYAETTGMLCDVVDGSTYTGTYLIEGGTGILASASGSGALSFGLVDNSFDDSGVTKADPAPVDGQLQMTGNISLSTAVSSCTGTGTKSNC
jgi:hypothetical protein